MTRTQIRNVPVEVYTPLPPPLTRPLPLPPSPPARCTLQGVPTVCVLDALAWTSQLLGVIDQANADRATAAQLGQPAPTDKGASNGR